MGHWLQGQISKGHLGNHCHGLRFGQGDRGHLNSRFQQDLLQWKVWKRQMRQWQDPNSKGQGFFKETHTPWMWIERKIGIVMHVGNLDI